MFGFKKSNPNMPDVMDLMKRAMSTYVQFSCVAFMCDGWMLEDAFIVHNASVADAFMQFVEEFPDADLNGLRIVCNL